MNCKTLKKWSRAELLNLEAELTRLQHLREQSKNLSQMRDIDLLCAMGRREAKIHMRIQQSKWIPEA